MEAGPLWVNVATWDPAEQHVIVADPGSRIIYVYNTNGRIQRRIASQGGGPLEFLTPNYAMLAGNRYLIATSMRRWLWFDQNLVARSVWELDWEEGDGGKYSQLAVSEFDSSDTHLYAIATSMDFEGVWTGKALFVVSLKDRSVRQVGRISADADESSFYSEPPFNIALCSGKAWLLEMAATVSIVEARDGGKRLRSFPHEFQRRPSVPRIVDAQAYQARRAALRQTAVAEGLFCADGRTLLLLAHRPRAGGGLQWLVYPIDPSNDTIAPPIELPTNVGDIVFVPGRKRWALFEKGPMKHPGVQPLTRMISFPRPALTVMKTTAPVAVASGRQP